MRSIRKTLGLVLLTFFAVTFTVYYWNLDMKLVRVVYDLLGRRYDSLAKDRRL